MVSTEEGRKYESGNLIETCIMLMIDLQEYGALQSKLKPKLEHLLKEIKNAEFSKKEYLSTTIKYLNDTLEYLDRIQKNYQMLTETPLPKKISEAKALATGMYEYSEKNKEPYKFWNYLAMSDATSHLLTPYQEEAFKDPEHNNERCKCFNDAYEAMHGRKGKVDIVKLTKWFVPELLNELFSGMIVDISYTDGSRPPKTQFTLSAPTGQHETEVPPEGIKDNHSPSQIETMTVPETDKNSDVTESTVEDDVMDSVVAAEEEQPMNKEDSSIAGSEPEQQGDDQKAEKKTQDENGLQTSSDSPRKAGTIVPLPEMNTAEAEKTGKNITSLERTLRKIELSESIELTVEKRKEMLKDYFENERNDINEIEALANRIPKNTVPVVYPEYESRTRIPEGAQKRMPVVTSFTVGALSDYQLLFLQYGVLNAGLVSVLTGKSEEQCNGSLIRLYNAGLTYRVRIEGNTYYMVRENEKAGLSDSWEKKAMEKPGVIPPVNAPASLSSRVPPKSAGEAYARYFKCICLMKILNWLNAAKREYLDIRLDWISEHQNGFNILISGEEKVIALTCCMDPTPKSLCRIKDFMITSFLSQLNSRFWYINITTREADTEMLNSLMEDFSAKYGILKIEAYGIVIGNTSETKAADDILSTLNDIYGIPPKTGNDNDRRHKNAEQETTDDCLKEEIQKGQPDGRKGHIAEQAPASAEQTSVAKQTEQAAHPGKEKETAQENDADNGFHNANVKHTKKGSTSKNAAQKELTSSKNKTQDSSIPPKKETVERKVALAPSKGMTESFKELSPLFDQHRYYTLFPYMQADPVLKDGKFYQMASYAFDEPGERHEYTSMKLTEIFSENMEYEQVQLLYVASAIRVLCSPSGDADYGTGAVYDTAKAYARLLKGTNFLKLLYEITNFKKKYNRGIWYYAGLIMRGSQKEQSIKTICAEAAKYYDEYIVNYIRAEKSNPRYMFLVKLMFDRGSRLAELLEMIKYDEREMLEAIHDELVDFLIRDGMPVSPENIDPAKIERYIDELWIDAGNAMRHHMKGTKLYGALRKGIVNKIFRIGETAAAWVVEVEAVEGGISAKDEANFRSIFHRMTRLTSDVYTSVSMIKQNPENVIGLYAIDHVIDECYNRFCGLLYSRPEYDKKYFYIRFLEDSYVTLNEHLLPETGGKYPNLPGFSLKERILAHAAYPLDDDHFSIRLKEILESDDPSKHDFGSAIQICNYLKVKGQNVDKELSEAKAAIDDHTLSYMLEAFREDIELAQGYGMLDNADDRKEQIIADVQKCFEACNKSGNFGFFYELLLRYRKRIEADSDARGQAVKEMYQQVTARESGYDVSASLKERINQMISLRNYTVAEDLIGRIQNGDVSESWTGMDMDFDYLYDFTKNFNSYYRMDRVPPKAAMPELAEIWIKDKKKNAGEPAIRQILSTLGFRGPIVKKIEGKKEDTYEVKLTPPASGRRNAYSHPIAAFGSEAEKTPFHLVCLYGTHSVAELFSALKSNGLSRHTIVLMTAKLSLPERHAIARKMRQELAEKAILIVDRPLMMYLAANCRPAVICQSLMQLAVPFTFYQPYVQSSSTDVRVEMFNGRKHELNEIESQDGANILYGGRQLGKSALLKMAVHEVDNNENGDRAVLVDIRSKGVEASALAISRELVKKNIIPEENVTDDWDSLSFLICEALEADDAPPFLLLMLDEADAFIEDCRHCEYGPIAKLKTIQEMPGNHFKFVIAGLRDVVRFTKGQAAGNNSVLPQLKAITVKPFEYNEARSLIEEPLWYLGFRFDERTEPLVNMILANTNYFPGLIQLYCAKLVDALKNHDYAGYDPSGTPPFNLTERHIKKVLADEIFTREVREKYFITLRLANDDYYYIIALLMADLYMREGTEGYNALDIWNLACELGIAKIASLETGALEALMEEMCELNVFRRSISDNHCYIFSRYNFYQMLGGTLTAVEDEIARYME